MPTIKEKISQLDIEGRISVEIDKNRDAAYFVSDKVKRFGWGECYLVNLDGSWYYSDFEGDNQRSLPSFVKTRADAEEFIMEANLWYIDGKSDGIHQAKSELRKWLQCDN